jgi:glycyl-tRNA synthetase
MNSDEILSIFKRRGVLWPSAEIYGGVQGLYDYGPAGVAVKRHLETAWEAWFLGLSHDYHKIEPTDMLPEAVVRASGHLEHFSDPLVTCENCGARLRADHVLEDNGVSDTEGLPVEELAARLTALHPPCPRCGKGPLGSPRAFNLMFAMEFGATGKEHSYLRPETAQGSYLAFARMWNVGRKRLPMGIAVVGKAFRNEIAPRQTLFRMREFTQAELQIFFDPTQYPDEWKAIGDGKLPILLARRRAEGVTEPEGMLEKDLVEKEGMPPFYVYHLDQIFRFMRDALGYPPDKIRLLEKNEKERAFYNRIHVDVEGFLPSLGGYKELGALHYRGDYDLTKHSEGSKSDLGVTMEDGRHFIPHVLEITFGVDRNLWALAEFHLKADEKRTVWSLPSYLTPTIAGVLPLIPKKHGALAEEVLATLTKEGLTAVMDESGSIGRRYARLDEMGVPMVITVDAQSETDHTYTLRERDSTAQKRLTLQEIVPLLRSANIPPRSHPA